MSTYLFALDKSEKKTLQNLKFKIHNFERRIYEGEKIKSSYIEQGYENLNKLIELYISLDDKYHESRFSHQAFSCLERKKNLKMIRLFTSTNCNDSLKNERQKLLLKNYNLLRNFDELHDQLNLFPTVP